MSKLSSRPGEPNPLGCAGISALAFAVSPSVAMGLVSIAEYQQRRGKPSGGGPVAFGVPPIWFIWIILLGLSIPWIITGILMLRRAVAGRWIALLLSLPTALLTILTCIGTIAGMIERNPEMARMNVSAFGPIALGGLLFCFTVWGTEYACRNKVKDTLHPESSMRSPE